MKLSALTFNKVENMDFRFRPSFVLLSTEKKQQQQQQQHPKDCRSSLVGKVIQPTKHGTVCQCATNGSVERHPDNGFYSFNPLLNLCFSFRNEQQWKKNKNREDSERLTKDQWRQQHETIIIINKWLNSLFFFFFPLLWNDCFKNE